MNKIMSKDYYGPSLHNGFCTPKRIRELTETAPDLKAKRARSPFNRDFMERYPESVELHNKIKNHSSNIHIFGFVLFHIFAASMKMALLYSCIT